MADGWQTVGHGKPHAAGGAAAAAGGDGGAVGVTNAFAALKVDPDARVIVGKGDPGKKKDKDRKKKKRDAKRLEKARQLLDANTKPGYIGNLNSSQQTALNEFRANVARFSAPNCLEGAPEGLTDPHLLRFLRARDFNAKKAQQMLEATLQWRNEYQPHKIQLQDVRIQFDRGCAWRHGTDKLGRPALFSRSGLHDPALGELGVRSTIYLMEEAARNLHPPHEGYAIVFDLTGYSNKNSDLSWCRSVIGCLQNYYPERMAVCLICNAPFAFRLLWAAIKGLFTARTADKIVFLGGDYQEKLLMYFDRSQLPPFLGGTSTFDPAQWIRSQLGPSSNPQANVDPAWLAAANSGMADDDFDEDDD